LRQITRSADSHDSTDERIVVQGKGDLKLTYQQEDQSGAVEVSRWSSRFLGRPGLYYFADRQLYLFVQMHGNRFFLT
jgi:hypothetical protein